MHPFLILLPGPDWQWDYRTKKQPYGPGWVLQQWYQRGNIWVSKYYVAEEFLRSVWNPEVALRLFCERNFPHLRS